MKNVTSVLLFISILFFLGCGQQKLSQEEIEDIKSEIRTLMSEGGVAFETGNVEYYQNVVSDDIVGFGCRTEEAVRTNPDEWVEAFQRIFQIRDSIAYTVKFGEPRHLSIQVSETGDMATAIYEDPYEVSLEGEIHPGFFRMANTWRKENGEWKIVQWLAARPVE